MLGLGGPPAEGSHQGFRVREGYVVHCRHKRATLPAVQSGQRWGQGPWVEAGRAGSRREKRRGVTQTDGGCRWHSLDASGTCSEWTDPSRPASGSGGS